MSSSSAVRGVCLVLAAAVLWGSTGTAQSLAPAALSAYWVGALRLAVAGLFFVAWLALTAPRQLQPRAWASLPWPGIAAGAAAMAAYNLAFFAGVRASGVAVGTAVALGSGPVWAGLLQALGGARLPAAWWAGTTLAVGGGALMVLAPAGGEAAGASGAGLLYCLAAGLAYAVYALVNKHMVGRAPAGQVTGAVFVTAALLALPVAAALAEWPVLGPRSWAVLAWLGVVSTGVAYLLFSHGLRHISGATGVALALAEPVMAFVLALVVVGERPPWGAWLGLGTVLAGLALVIRSEMRAVPHAPAPPAGHKSGGAGV